AISRALGLRPGQRIPACRLHDPDAASWNRSLPQALSHSQRAGLVQVRHAPRALGASARRQTLLRALRRDLATLDPEYRRREELVRLDEADPAEPNGFPDPSAHSDAANDESRGVPEGAREFTRSSAFGSRRRTAGFVDSHSPFLPGEKTTSL